ncbi:MAG: hypothetical protein CSB24_00315 [Deltaproteobacteria bacterium]|nr:MAG: hypothetical protein CSB24_00315 [Deltaproteobacteria bacterium]
MKQLLLLVGMVMVLEAIPYLAFPETMKKWLAKMAETDASLLRGIGFFSMLGGLFICWLAQKSGIFM